jgi:hypothetical protein
VTLTVAEGPFTEGAHDMQGANPTMGNAFTIFDRKVSGQGVLSYIDDVNNSLVLTFTDLDPLKTYDLTFFAHRRSGKGRKSGLESFLDTEAFVAIEGACSLSQCLIAMIDDILYACRAWQELHPQFVVVPRTSKN